MKIPISFFAGFAGDESGRRHFVVGMSRPFRDGRAPGWTFKHIVCGIAFRFSPRPKVIWVWNGWRAELRTASNTASNSAAPKPPVVDTARAARLLRAAVEDAETLLKALDRKEITFNQGAVLSQVFVNIANAKAEAGRAGIERATLGDLAPKPPVTP